MPIVGSLKLARCPHCRVDSPNLSCFHRFSNNNSEGGSPREWGFYSCARCGGVITAWTQAGTNYNAEPREWFPGEKALEDSIPNPARAYLDQAISSVHAPAGAVMLAASSVDAMLKVKGYKEGSLFKRIEKAAEDHLITRDMAAWAHEIRLDANDQRHADEEATLPDANDAQRVIAFATALAEFLFVLPARVQHGRGKDSTTSIASESLSKL